MKCPYCHDEMDEVRNGRAWECDDCRYLEWKKQTLTREQLLVLNELQFKRVSLKDLEEVREIMEDAQYMLDRKVSDGERRMGAKIMKIAQSILKAPARRELDRLLGESGTVSILDLAVGDKVTIMRNVGIAVGGKVGMIVGVREGPSGPSYNVRFDNGVEMWFHHLDVKPRTTWRRFD